MYLVTIAVGESTQAEEQQMYRPAFMRQALRLRLWVALSALALSACGAAGGEHQQAKGHPLPKYEKASLPAGEYHTMEFKPSLSFRITGGRCRESTSRADRLGRQSRYPHPMRWLDGSSITLT